MSFLAVFSEEEQAKKNERRIVEMKNKNGHTYYEVQDGFGNQLWVAETQEAAQRAIDNHYYERNR